MSEKNSPKPELLELSSQEKDELRERVEAGRVLVGDLGNAPSPRRMAEAIAARIDDLRSTHGTLSLRETAALGALYGEAIRLATGWNWRVWVLRRTKAFALVSADEAHAHLPIRYIASQIELPPDKDSTILLLINMLIAGRRPPSSPGQLAIIH